MLVFTVRDDEAVTIGDDIKIIVRRAGKNTKIYFDTPKDIPIKRVRQSTLKAEFVAQLYGERVWIRKTNGE